MKYEIKERQIGEMLDVSMRLFLDHFILLLKISSIALLPVIIISNFIQAYLKHVMDSGADRNEMMLTAMGVNAAILLVYSMLVQPLTQVAVLKALSDEYLGKRAESSGSFRAALKRFPALVWTQFLYMLWVFAGFVAFILPGVYLLLKYYLAIQIVALEDRRGSDALRRSGELMRGNIGKAMLLGMVVGLGTGTVSVIAALVPGVWLGMLANSAVQLAVFMFGSAVSVVFYFNTRCSNEHFDLVILAKELGYVRAEPGTPEAEA